ncbi:MAG: hypothetical protein LKI88_00935 [Bifidobacterium sp.]|jgi:hypothetical protein|nr:hypothetical protein [Bifidobacterium sp.]
MEGVEAMEETRPFAMQRKRALPCHDGTIPVELSLMPVRYHFSRCFLGEIGDEECREIAMSACRIACMALDVSRGKISSMILRRLMTSVCIKRLETLSLLMLNHMRTDSALRRKMCVLPVIPRMINGMIISPDTLEISVHVMIGDLHHWTSLVLRRMGSRWMCTTADVG